MHFFVEERSFLGLWTSEFLNKTDPPTIKLKSPLVQAVWNGDTYQDLSKIK